MIDHLFQTIQGVFAAHGIRKALWLALVLVFSLTFFEAYTQYFASASLSSRLKLIQEADQTGVSAERHAQLAQMRDALVGEIVLLEEERKAPQTMVVAALLRFAKGAYIFVPIGWLVVKFTFRVVQQAEKLPQRTVVLGLGFYAFSAVVWCATLLGLVSVIWNRSPGILSSWFLFPICAAGSLIVVGGWLAILKFSLPQENASNRQPSGSAKPADESAARASSSE